MHCELIGGECNIDGNNCSGCPVASQRLTQATQEYLVENDAVHPVFTIVRSHGIGGRGTIYTLWFNHVVAEVADGHLVVARPL